MKRFILDFLRRGSVACGLGPIVLAILYLILRQSADVVTLTVDQVCVGFFTLTVLAFLAGGMNAVYQIERLPLMVAILIHGAVLYAGYLATYLLNGWLEGGIMPVVIFTGVFVVGYLVIWGIIYAITKRNTEKLNAHLQKKQQTEDR